MKSQFVTSTDIADGKLAGVGAHSYRRVTQLVDLKMRQEWMET